MIPEPYADLIRGALMIESGWLIVVEVVLMIAHRLWRDQGNPYGAVGQRLTLAATGVSVISLGIIVGLWAMIGKPATYGSVIVLVGLSMLVYSVTGMMTDTQRRIR